MSTFRVAHRTRFTTVDRTTVNDKTLSFRARGILIWLLDKPDDWRCGAEQIAAAGGEGREAVRSALRELEQAGYLRRERVQDKATGQWTTMTTVYEKPPGGTDDGFPVIGSLDIGFPGAKENTVNRRLLQKTLLPNTLGESDVVKPPKTAPLSVAESQAFEVFWKLYPRKVAKQAAFKAWRATRKTASAESICDGAQWWVCEWKRERTEQRFIPYPATFLNSGQHLTSHNVEAGPDTAKRPRDFADARSYGETVAVGEARRGDPCDPAEFANLCIQRDPEWAEAALVAYKAMHETSWLALR